MVGRILSVTLILMVTALAGCAGEDGNGGPGGALDEQRLEDQVSQDLDVKATATTGVIRGVVVDESITPVAGATVTVKVGEKSLTTETTPSGSFGFQGLEPGTYFVKVTRLGYQDAQQSVEVEAGVDAPPIIKVQLVKDVGFRKPYVSVVKFDGFVECTTSVLVLCGAPNLLTGENYTNDRFTWDQFLEPNATLIQSELFWDTTQAASPELYYEQELLHDGCTDTETTFLNSTSGSSPIYTTISAEQVEENHIGGPCPIYFSIFSGDAVSAAAGGTNPVCDADLPCIGVGATVQQQFSMITHSFYGFTPPAGWRFSVDGAPTPPT